MEYIKESLLKNIVEYCRINDLDVSDYINKLLSDAYNLDRYGNRPNIGNKSEIHVETKRKEYISPTTKVEEKPIPKKQATKKVKTVQKIEEVKQEEQPKRRKLK